MRIRLSQTASTATAFLLACWCAAPARSFAQGATTYPRQVLIIRHAEKPSENAQSVNLSPEGKERAAALAGLFTASDQRPVPFTTPDFIFAAKNSKHSHRSLETVQPLASKLRLTVNTNYANEDSEKLVQEILHNPKYAGKTILIAWHHGNIPLLSRQFQATDVPSTWKGTTFDRVWQITFGEKGELAFRNLPQHLLPRDSDK